MSRTFFALCLIVLLSPAQAATVVSEFDAFDSNHWHMAHGWTNGPPTAVGWRADHVTFDQGVMTLTLDDVPCSSDTAQCSGQSHASGEYRNNAWTGFGLYEVRMKAAKAPGVVSSFFVFTGPVDNPANPWDEIDIEFLGKDTTKVQFNFFANGVGGNEHLHDLGFDASEGFHDYAFDWRPDGIVWYVDGQLVHSFAEGAVPVTAGRIMMDLWAVVPEFSAWAGEFNYTQPVTAQYEWVKYTPMETTAVPVPPALGSFALGLAGFLGLKVMRSKA